MQWKKLPFAIVIARQIKLNNNNNNNSELYLFDYSNTALQNRGNHDNYCNLFTRAQLQNGTIATLNYIIIFIY